jgi:Tfp pilus assembly protein PilF
VPALLKQGELAQAEFVLVEALGQNPRDLTAYRYLGMVYLRRGDYAQAKEVCEEAVRRSPDATAFVGTTFTMAELRSVYENLTTELVLRKE